ncbi:hypothetical protein BDK92_7173 [Micromonospora pisi]|uniref:YgjP-like metallopeptidase domain-containing protein n=1 Tax=Micromonospora pisi TaxID=589240 RepID=A0A495JVX7_9ACTN|nr:YgjP-like metallopeptidase domain-containing protein [Micromonospora pisi]RKR92695.1 hypothetical protein BDK92_7173 [Micromonospora pisi]
MTTDTAAAPYVTALTAAALPDWLRWRVEIRPRRRSLGIITEPGGQVVIAIPPGVDPQRVVAVVQASLAQLRRHVRDSEESALRRPVKELVNGEGFPLLGANHRLRLVGDADMPIVGEPGPSTWSGVRTRQLTLRRDAASAATIVGWYQAQGQAFADRYAPEMAARLGVADGLTVRVRGYRPGQGVASWGTYRPRTHSISLHWSLFQLPREMPEAVLAHEVAHAARPSGGPHGRGWERLFVRLVPEWRERARELELAARSMWFGDVAP